MSRRRSLLWCVWVLALGCNSAQTGRSRIDPTLVAFAPSDAVMLTGVRMDEVRATPVYQKLLAQKRLEALDNFARETGFDPRKDVRELLFVSRGGDMLVSARGVFNLREALGMTKTTYKGF